MRQIEKKVTKKLAMEIAAKFFGRTVQPKEQDNGYVFIEGLIKFEVFPYYTAVSESILSEKHPYGHAYINSECKYIEYCAITGDPTNGAVMCDFEFERCPLREEVKARGECSEPTRCATSLSERQGSSHVVNELRDKY